MQKITNQVQIVNAKSELECKARYSTAYILYELFLQSSTQALT